MANSSDFAGKVALVTGAGQGLGRAIVDILAARGAAVVVAEIDPATGAAAADALKQTGAKAHFVRVDVSDEDQVAAMVQETLATFGGLDIAINNAAIEGEVKPLVEQDSAVMRKVLAVDLAGVFYCLKHQLPAMVAQGRGAIVNVASVAGVRAHPGLAPYVAAKHGVNGLTKTAAIEYGPMGVRVNSLCPGGIMTPQLARYMEHAPELRASIIDMNPLRRLSEAEEMARAAVWLASDEASYVNGHEMVVDGGRTVSDC